MMIAETLLLFRLLSTSPDPSLSCPSCRSILNLILFVSSATCAPLLRAAMRYGHLRGRFHSVLEVLMWSNVTYSDVVQPLKTLAIRRVVEI
jgi:hypothetical protein